MPNRTVVCRCEEITLEEIRDLINQGFQSLDEIKRISRCGMGPCQGRGCREIVTNELAKLTGKTPEQIAISKYRPPVKPFKLGLLLGGEADDA